MDCRFPKAEKLKSRKLLDDLFLHKKGKAITAWPLRMVYMNIMSNEELGMSNGLAADEAAKITHYSLLITNSPKVLVSVSKRHFKHAVDRNRIKRQIRECYRLNKNLIPKLETPVAIAFIWLCNEHMPTYKIERKMQSLLPRISQ